MNPLTEAWLAKRASIRESRVRLGLEGYLHLAAMLQETPMTAVQLTTAAGLGHVASYRFLCTLHHLRRVRIVGWERRPRVSARPIYAWGSGADVAPPHATASGRPTSGVRSLPMSRTAPALLAFGHMMDAIEHCANRLEVVEKTGLDRTVVGRALDLAVKLGIAHIPVWQWRDQGGAPIPQYQMGAGRSAPKPYGCVAKRAAAVKRQQHKAAVKPFVPLINALAAWAPVQRPA
jgi:hypothetical protein